MHRRILFLALPLLLLISGCGSDTNKVACNPKQKPSAIYGIDGPLVTDLQTGLVWMRCPIGQEWDASATGDSKCTGMPRVTSWDEGLRLAREANAESLLGKSNWRLPNIRELFSLADFSCESIAINQSVFPDSGRSYVSSNPVRLTNGRVVSVAVDFSSKPELFFEQSGAVRFVRDSE